MGEEGMVLQWGRGEQSDDGGGGNGPPVEDGGTVGAPIEHKGAVLQWRRGERSSSGGLRDSRSPNRAQRSGPPTEEGGTVGDREQSEPRGAKQGVKSPTTPPHPPRKGDKRLTDDGRRLQQRHRLLEAVRDGIRSWVCKRLLVGVHFLFPALGGYGMEMGGGGGWRTPRSAEDSATPVGGLRSHGRTE